jgi:hypothetical protein
MELNAIKESFMDQKIFEKKKYIYHVYLILLFFKVASFAISVLWVLSTMVILFEPFLPSFQVGRDGSIALFSFAIENFGRNFIILAILISITFFFVFFSNIFRKRNSDIIDYWSLGRY